MTIDFGNTVNSDFTPGQTYTEDNFQFTVLWEINGASATMSAIPPLAFCVWWDRYRRHDFRYAARGGLFSFTAVDFAAAFSGQTGGFDLIGFVNGVQTNIFSSLNSSSNTFQTLNLLWTPIDELRIVGASQGNSPLLLDNFVFNRVSAVPEAGSTALLMGVALAGWFATRRFLVARAA